MSRHTHAIAIANLLMIIGGYAARILWKRAQNNEQKFDMLSPLLFGFTEAFKLWFLPTRREVQYRFSVT